MRVTTTYDAVKLSARRTFTCQVCGKRGTKSCTFRQTLNPYNRNAQGLPKTEREIWGELQCQAAAWEPEPIHDKCRPDE